MIKFSYKLSGFTELDAKLKSLPVKVENQILQASVTKAMRDQLTDLRAVMPQGPVKSLDRKHHSIKAAADWANQVAYGSAKKALRIIRLKQEPKGVKGARIDTGNAFWMFWYELGNRRQAARPVFGPFFASRAEKILNNLGEDLGAKIEKEASGK